MADSEAANIAVGAVGSFAMLLAYTLLSCRRHVPRVGCLEVSEESLLYCSLNLVGGSLASASAIMTRTPGSYPLAVLEGAWAIVGAVGLWHLAMGRWRLSTAVPAAASDDDGAGNATAAAAAVRVDCAPSARATTTAGADGKS